MTENKSVKSKYVLWLYLDFDQFKLSSRRRRTQGAITSEHELANQLVPTNCVKVHYWDLERAVAYLLPGHVELEGLEFTYFFSY